MSTRHDDHVTYSKVHSAPAVRNSVSALENTLNSEVARRALFRPFDPESLRTDDTGPIQEIVAYNLLHGPHLEVFHNKTAIPGRFSDVKPLGFKMLYESFGATAHMNGILAAPRAGLPRPAPHVRTFLEALQQCKEDGSRHVIGWRVVHVNYAANASAAAAYTAPSTKKASKKKRNNDANDAAADLDEEDEDDDGEGSDAAAEVSIDGNEEDEEAIRRRDKKLLDRKASAKAAGEHDRQMTQTFNGGFAQMVRDGAVHRELKMALSDSSPAASGGPSAASTSAATAKNAYKQLLTDLKDNIQLYLTYKDAFELSMHEQQYAQVLRMYLNMHKCVDTWNDELDPRPFASPQAPFKRDTHGPAQILDMVTAVTYYGDVVCNEQRDLTRYFDMPLDTITAVLAQDKTFRDTADDAMGRALASANLDVMDMLAMAPEDTREYTRIADKERLDHVRALFVNRPERFHYMLHANFKPAQFSGFPFPDLVFELDPEFCRPEAIFQLPLPMPLFTPLTGAHVPPMRDSPEFFNDLCDMMRTFMLIASSNKSAANHIYKRDAMATVITNRQSEYLAALRLRMSDMFTARKSTVKHGVSLLPSGTLTPEGAVRLIHVMAEQNRLFGVASIGDWALSSVCRQFETLVSDASGRGGLHTFRDVFTEAYNVMLATFGIVNERNETDQYVAALRAQAHLNGEAEVPRNDSEMQNDLANVDVDVKTTAEMMGQIHSGIQAFISRTTETLEHLQTTDPEAANTVRTAEESQGTANYLGNVPEDIIALDDALQLYRKNSTTYARLMLEFTHEKSTTETSNAFGSRLWNCILEAAAEAHTTFFESDNVDGSTKKAREWFMALPPESRKVEFRMLYDVRPDANMRIFVTESLASPAVNASQNMLAMQLTYFSSLHACRWYINSNDPKTNVLLAGDGTSGKSYILHVIDYLSPQGVASTLTYMSNHAMHVKANNDGYLTLFHEAMHRLLHPNSTGKDGAAAESGDAANFLKDRLTRGRCSVLVLQHDPKTKERKQLFFETSAQGVYIMCTNDALKGADENVLSRFIVFSVPKPRDQAEGLSPTERVVDPGIEGQRYVASHYSERVTLEHRVLRFRYMYMEFMIKAGVIPDGFQTYGGRILIDNILNDVHEKFSIETRDPRRRKITEEMARSMAGLYACFMGLGSPLAMWYAKMTEAQGGDLWSPEAFLLLTAPFMYIAKDHVIDALSILETIWTPQYDQRILFTATFSVAQLHHMRATTFRIIAPSAHDSNSGSGVQGTRPGDIDWRYVAIEGDNDNNINQRISEHCSKYGIRTADVDARFFKLSRVWKPLRPIYRVTSAVDAPKSPAPPAPPALSTGDYLSRLTAVNDHEGEMSDASEFVEQMDRELDAHGPENTRLPSPKPRTAAAHSDRVTLAFDNNAGTERAPVVIREFVNPDRRAKDGRRLCISVEFLMNNMPFDITRPETMETYVASDKSRPRNAHPVVPIEPESLRPNYKGKRWGDKCSVNFVQRVTEARKMATMDVDSMSPVMRCAHDLLSNAYLETVPAIDVEANAYMEALKLRHAKEVATSTDPAKSTALPWLSYVTSISVNDYTLKSKDAKRYPEGRSISFYDLLRFMRLTRNVDNKRPIMRHNYARLSVFSKEMLAFEPLGSVASQRSMQYGKDTPIIGALDRSFALNNAIKIGYMADIDYYEASMRMKSMAHPGIPGLHMSRLMSFPPFTYDIVRTITQELIHNGAYAPVQRAKEVIYPEDDPALPLEYPTHAIVKRIRETEIVDANEFAGDWGHATSADEIYKLSSTVGALNFRHLEEDAKKRLALIEKAQQPAAAASAPSSNMSGPLTKDAKRCLGAFAPSKMRRKSVPVKMPAINNRAEPRPAPAFGESRFGWGKNKTKRADADHNDQPPTKRLRMMHEPLSLSSDDMMDEDGAVSTPATPVKPASKPPLSHFVSQNLLDQLNDMDAFM